MPTFSPTIAFVAMTTLSLSAEERGRSPVHANAPRGGPGGAWFGCAVRFPTGGRACPDVSSVAAPGARTARKHGLGTIAAAGRRPPMARLHQRLGDVADRGRHRLGVVARGRE